MRAYYNENEPFCVEWLKNLIAAELIPAGDVDDRSIEQVQPNDLRGYDQWHFFAGISGWCRALSLVGLSSVPGICTGSPPCQDNSVAQSIHGERQGLRGVRSGLAHQWLDLVGELQPGLVLFENVSGIKKWQAEITGRLAGFGYSVAVRNLSAACAGAPNPRRRVWIAADRDGTRLAISRQARSPAIEGEPWPAPYRNIWSQDHPATGRLDHGLSCRMAAIHAFGNAICPQTAARFVAEYLKNVS